MTVDYLFVMVFNRNLIIFVFPIVGHSLQEIRCRALENIISKLHYDIVPIEELLYFKDLYPNLLEFLNKHQEEEKVLNLLLDLSKVCCTVLYI